LDFLTKFVADPYFLSLTADIPRLLLNKGFEGLPRLLEDRGRRPAAERALHDQTRGNIAADVWTAMFLTSLEAAEREDPDGPASWPEATWQEGVLKSLLPRLYEDLGPDDALVEALTATSTSEGMGALQERLLPAVLEHAHVPRLLRDGIRRLELADDQEIPEVSD
jgi:hypothetical protein